MIDLSVRIKSYPKINLFLGLCGYDSHSYHNLTTLMIQIREPYDILSFTDASSSRIQIKIHNDSELQKEHIWNNTVYKVISSIQNGFNHSVGKNVLIEIYKNIPQKSGMGGGSSNAAKTLVYLNSKHLIGMKDNEMIDVCSGVGWDVPFFIDDTPALCNGGIKYTPQRIKMGDIQNYMILLVDSEADCPTKQIYDASRNDKSKIKRNMVKKTQLYSFASAINVAKKIGNDLQKYAILQKDGYKIKDTLEKIDLIKPIILSSLTGSGSFCFGIFKKKHLEEVNDSAKKIFKEKKFYISQMIG